MRAKLDVSVHFVDPYIISGVIALGSGFCVSQNGCAACVRCDV